MAGARGGKAASGEAFKGVRRTRMAGEDDVALERIDLGDRGTEARAHIRLTRAALQQRKFRENSRLAAAS